jgi:hypothetical protein
MEWTASCTIRQCAPASWVTWTVSNMRLSTHSHRAIAPPPPRHEITSHSEVPSSSFPWRSPTSSPSMAPSSSSPCRSPTSYPSATPSSSFPWRSLSSSPSTDPIELPIQHPHRARSGGSPHGKGFFPIAISLPSLGLPSSSNFDASPPPTLSMCVCVFFFHPKNFCLIGVWQNV